jgi:predicted RNase H-like HicB family nuclease
MVGAHMAHDLDYYLAVPYMLAVESIEKEDGDWVRRAEYPELPDCYAEAFAAVDAIEKLEERRVQVLKEMLERGEEIPVPRPPLISDSPELDKDRLGFARWLVDEKKISDA